MKIFIYVLMISLSISQIACEDSSVNSNEQMAKLDKLSNIIRDTSFVCYSPTQFDPNPNYQKIPTIESIREDLKLLRPYFNGLITYGTNGGLEKVPAIAKEMGYRAMIIGIWDIKADMEVKKAIQLTKEYPEFVFAVCCGNEGITMNRYDFQTLENAMNQIRQSLPSTYIVTSEPIHSYGDPNIVELGEFCFPIIHPIFSGINKFDPITMAQWVFQCVDTLRKSTQKPILVKETGLPSAGYSDCSPQNQAIFWSTIFSKGKSIPNIEYAAFEAYDLPWKVRDAGLEVEAHWGFWDQNRKPKPVVSMIKKL